MSLYYAKHKVNSLSNQEQERLLGMDQDERYINERCSSLAPITLTTLRHLGKNKLIEVILLREINFNDLLKQMNINTTTKRVQKFIKDGKGDQIYNSGLWFQRKINDSIKVISRLEIENNNLKNEIIKLKIKSRD